MPMKTRSRTIAKTKDEHGTKCLACRCPKTEKPPSDLTKNKVVIGTSNVELSQLQRWGKNLDTLASKLESQPELTKARNGILKFVKVEGDKVIRLGRKVFTSPKGKTKVPPVFEEPEVKHLEEVIQKIVLSPIPSSGYFTEGFLVDSNSETPDATSALPFDPNRIRGSPNILVPEFVTVNTTDKILNIVPELSVGTLVLENDQTESKSSGNGSMGDSIQRCLPAKMSSFPQDVIYVQKSGPGKQWNETYALSTFFPGADFENRLSLSPVSKQRKVTVEVLPALEELPEFDDTPMRKPPTPLVVRKKPEPYFKTKTPFQATKAIIPGSSGSKKLASGARFMMKQNSPIPTSSSPGWKTWGSGGKHVGKQKSPISGSSESKKLTSGARLMVKQNSPIPASSSPGWKTYGSGGKHLVKQKTPISASPGKAPGGYERFKLGPTFNTGFQSMEYRQKKINAEQLKKIEADRRRHEIAVRQNQVAEQARLAISKNSPALKVLKPIKAMHFRPLPPVHPRQTGLTGQSPGMKPKLKPQCALPSPVLEVGFKGDEPLDMGHMSTYDITRVEDFDEVNHRHRKGKKIPTWATDDKIIATSLFQAIHADKYASLDIFPAPPREKLFPDAKPKKLHIVHETIQE